MLGSAVGLSLAKFFSMKWGVETGFFIARRRYELNVVKNGKETISGNDFFYYQIPALLRLRVARYFSIGAGGYYSRFFPAVSHPGFRNDDYGLQASLRLQLLPSQSVGFALEARYSYGLQNTALSSSETLHNRDLMVLIGLTFHLGSSKK